MKVHNRLSWNLTGFTDYCSGNNQLH